MTIVDVRGRLDEHTLMRVVNQALDKEGQPRDTRYEINFRDLGFIEPAGVVVLSNLIARLKAQGASGYLHAASWTDKPGQYLADTGFLAAHVTSGSVPEPRLRDTMFRLETVEIGAGHGYSWVRQRFIPWLARCMKVQPEELDLIEVSLHEIMNNIRDHADADAGCAFAQFYPNKQTLQFAVSDFGVGIPSRIRRAYDVGSDADAIAKAIEEGVSSQSTPGNRGAGLSTLVDYVARQSKSRLKIMSASGCIDCYCTDSGLITSPVPISGHYPGTLVILEVSTDHVPLNPVDEETSPW